MPVSLQANTAKVQDAKVLGMVTCRCGREAYNARLLVRMPVVPCELRIDAIRTAIASKQIAPENRTAGPLTTIDRKMAPKSARRNSLLFSSN